jgi:transposase
MIGVSLMYLKKSYRKNSDRTYLVLAQKYWDSKTGKAKDRSIKSLGYLDELEKEYADPVAHFKEVAKRMTEEENAEKNVTITIDLKEKLPEVSVGARNLGYSVPLKVYHKLGINKFLNGKSRIEKFDFNANSIMILLAISRILSPGSKLKAYEEKHRYFERFDFTLDDVYRSLTFFDKVSGDLQRYMHESIRSEFGSDTSVIYYDVTNYYFEIDKPDDLRRYSGNAKQKRKKPVVQLGLAMDKDGIPMQYELFPGNKLDKETFRSVIGNIRRNYDTGRIIVVADMGIITGDNIYYLVGNKPEKPMNGYVFSFSVRGGTDAFQAYVLSDSDYTDMDGKPVTDETDFKVKSRIIAREISVTMESGKTQNKIVYEKQVVFWNKKYYTKARSERAEVIAKAEALVADPMKYNKATSYGAAAYVDNLEYNKKTGEVITTKKQLSINSEKVEAEERFDGYYAIVTSELSMSVADIISTYRGLWEIEDTFRITKSELLARPVYVHDFAHINAHFLICFIALTVLRLIQKVTGNNYSAEKIVDCLNSIECMHEYENMYLFGYRSSISDFIGKAFGFDFSSKHMSLAGIKKFIGDCKK